MIYKIGVFILFLFLVHGCAHRSLPPSMPPPVSSPSRAALYKKPCHIVKKGDSLWLISKKYGVSIDALMEENNIAHPSRIKVGQKLAIPFSQSHLKKQLLFLFPVHGTIIHYFGEVIDKRINKGLKIKTDGNTPVYSAMRGEVVFTSYLKGYGNTVIIEHQNNFATVYANLSQIAVKKGDMVLQNHILGYVAHNSQHNMPLLHFEVRNGYKAEDPLLYLVYDD